MATSEEVEFKEERWQEFARQLSSHAVRTQLIQRALTSFYAALGAFVAATMAIGIVAFIPKIGWMPSVLGIGGTLVLFHGCVLLIAEARLALRSVTDEMAFALKLSEMYRKGKEVRR
jgi:protein-S-isoprenylcysteine O-methyltransferase Ste14